jgi:hypothetical protein
MSNNEKEIQMIVEEGNDNADYLINRKNTKGDYSKVEKITPESTSTEVELIHKTESVTTMSIISKIFYAFSILTIFGMFMYLSGLSEFESLKYIKFMSFQFFIICSYFSSAFIFFSLGELFVVVDRIDKNTKK